MEQEETGVTQGCCHETCIVKKADLIKNVEEVDYFRGYEVSSQIYSV